MALNRKSKYANVAYVWVRLISHELFMHCICLLICIIRYLLDTVVKIKGVAYVEATEAAA